MAKNKPKITQQEAKAMGVGEILYLAIREEFIPKEWLLLKTKAELVEFITDAADRGVLDAGFLGSHIGNLPEEIQNFIE